MLLTRAAVAAAVAQAVCLLLLAGTISAQAPCACPASYEPVCDIKGKRYPNAQCAACSNVSATSLWPCPDPITPANKPQDNCMCASDYNPVCDANNIIAAPNSCTASCKGYAAQQVSACMPAAPSVKQALACPCPFIYAPVCDWQGITIGGNECVAKCQGYAPGQYKPCFEVSPFRQPRDGARSAAPCPPCPAVYDPVCNQYGYEVAPSQCVANCTVKEDARPFLRPCSSFSNRGAGDTAPENPPKSNCACTMEYAPVCADDGKEKGSNSCEAQCKGYSPSQLHPCFQEAKPVDTNSTGGSTAGVGGVSCACTRELFPQCLNNGTQVGANPCVATCAGWQGQFVPCSLLPFQAAGANASGANASTAAAVLPGVRTDPKPMACRCTREYDPQCDSLGTKVANNKCGALCNGYAPSEVLPCSQTGPAPAAAVQEAERATSRLCRCTKELRPVCDAHGTQVGSNKCIAECRGYAGFNETFCSQPPVKPCAAAACPASYLPVCDAKGSVLGANACEAACKGYNASDFSEGDCSQEHLVTEVLPVVAAKECMCSMQYFPVCDDQGTVVAANACGAKCAGYPEGSYRPCSFIQITDDGASSSARSGFSRLENSTASLGLQTVCVVPELGSNSSPIVCATFNSTAGYAEPVPVPVPVPSAPARSPPAVSNSSSKSTHSAAATHASSPLALPALLLLSTLLMELHHHVLLA